MKLKHIAAIASTGILSSASLADNLTQKLLDQLKGPWNEQDLTAEEFNRKAQESAVDSRLPKKYFEVRDERGKLADVKIHLEESNHVSNNENALELEINRDIIGQYNRSFTREDFKEYGMPSQWPLPEDSFVPAFMEIVNLENGKVWFTYQKLNEDVIRNQEKIRGYRPRSIVDNYAAEDEYTADNPAGIRLRRGVRYTMTLIEEPTARPTIGLSLGGQARINGREPEPYYADFPPTTVIGGLECKVKVILPRRKSNAKPNTYRLDKCD